MWNDLCAVMAAQWHVEGTMRLLEAFSRPSDAVGDPVPEFDAFETLETTMWESVSPLAALSAALMDDEVGPQQASMFAGRFLNLCRFLERLGEERFEARILAVGLIARMTEICHDQAPRSARIRALVDYYYSHGAKADWAGRHRQTPLPSVNQLLGTLTWERLAKGIRHGSLEADTSDGPVSLHVFQIDQGKAHFSAMPVVGAAAHESLHALVDSHNSVAGFTGGFFLYSEPDITLPQKRFDPVGLLVSNGNVLNPPTLMRPFFFQDSAGFVGISRMSMKGVTVSVADGPQLRIGTVNPSVKRFDSPSVFTRSIGTHTLPLPGIGLSIVGRHVVSVHLRETAPIPVNGFVLALPPGKDWITLGESIASAEILTYQLPPIPGFKPIRDAMAGGPSLLGQGAVARPGESEEFGPWAPPVTLGTDETGDQNLLPRLAIGITQTFGVVVLAVDGRNLSRSFGASLSMMAKWMRTLGAHTALNMDGGSTKRMASAHRTFGLPSEGLEDGTPSQNSTRQLASAWILRAENISDPGR